METKEGTKQPLPRDKIPYAEEIAARVKFLTETTPNLRNYLRTGRLWLTWGWYMELLCEEHDSTDQKVLDIIRNIYDTKAPEETCWQQLTDTILRYLARRGNPGERERLLLSCAGSLPEFVMTQLLQEKEIKEFILECLMWGENTQILEIAKRFLRIQMRCHEQRGEVLPGQYFNLGFAVLRRGKLTEQQAESLTGWIRFLEEVTEGKPEERAVCNETVISAYGQVCRFRENRKGAKPGDEEWKLWDREEAAFLQWIRKMKGNGTEAIPVCLQNIFKENRYFVADGIRNLCEKLPMERSLSRKCLYQTFTDEAVITHQNAREYYHILKYLLDTFCLTGEIAGVAKDINVKNFYQWLRYLDEAEILFLYEEDFFPEGILGELLYLAKERKDSEMLSLFMNFW